MDQGLRGKGKRKGEDQEGEGGERKGEGGEGQGCEEGEVPIHSWKVEREGWRGGEEGGISGVGGVWSRGNQKPHDNLTKKIERRLQ